MARKRPSSQKREREYRKRERDLRKAEKAAEKRLRRSDRGQQQTLPPEAAEAVADPESDENARAE